jgi:hypothetical protein
MAQGGVKDPGRLDEVLAKAYAIIEGELGRL